MKVDLRNTKPMITVITDASYCPETKIGGWAAWCVSDNNRHKVSGQLAMQMASSNEAELCALVNGLHSALYFFRPANKTIVLMQSDNTHALQTLGQAPGAVSGALQFKAATTFLRLKNEFNFQPRKRHVKGHQANQKGSRYYVNNWCDKEAKREMRELRDRIKGVRA